MTDPYAVPEGAICTNCKVRPATLRWVGDGGVMALTHGGSTVWCELCVVRAQADYAAEGVRRLETLNRRLAELEAADSKVSR